MPNNKPNSAYGGQYAGAYRSQQDFQDNSHRDFRSEEQKEYHRRYHQATDERQRMYEELLRQQRMYEERMRNEWFNTQTRSEDFMRIQEEILNERARILKLKFMVFGSMFLFLFLFSRVVMGIYSTPEYVVYDKTTGRRMVVTERQLEELQQEQIRRQFELRRQRAASTNLEDEIRRIIIEQGKGPSSSPPT